MRLPGVGKKKAEAIVATRDKRPFRKTDEVLRVKGLSQGWYARVKGILTVGDAPAPARPAEPARGAR
jgi:competence protein ComEA